MDHREAAGKADGEARPLGIQVPDLHVAPATTMELIKQTLKGTFARRTLDTGDPG